MTREIINSSPTYKIQMHFKFSALFNIFFPLIDINIIVRKYDSSCKLELYVIVIYYILDALHEKHYSTIPILSFFVSNFLQFPKV